MLLHVLLYGLAFDFKSSLNRKYKDEIKIATQILH